VALLTSQNLNPGLVREALQTAIPDLEASSRPKYTAPTADYALLLLLGLALGAVSFYARIRFARAEKSSKLYDQLSRSNNGWFETSIFIENADISYEFKMRLAHDELQSRDLLLESIARVGLEATGVPFNFSSVLVEHVDKRGNRLLVRTDADCRQLDDAVSIRITHVVNEGRGFPSTPIRGSALTELIADSDTTPLVLGI
jgi:hypothetical protein